MSGIDIGTVAAAMLAASKASLQNNWPKVKEYMTGEAQKIALTFAQIETLKQQGKITEAEAHVLLEMQENASRAVLLAVQGMGMIAVEEAINAALGAVSDIVNGALGFALI